MSASLTLSLVLHTKHVTESVDSGDTGWKRRNTDTEQWGFWGLGTDISDALTISGITGITFHWTDIDRVSAKVVAIELTFKGNIETDTILTFTLGAGAIENYNW